MVLSWKEFKTWFSKWSRSLAPVPDCLLRYCQVRAFWSSLPKVHWKCLGLASKWLNWSLLLSITFLTHQSRTRIGMATAFQKDSFKCKNNRKEEVEPTEIECIIDFFYIFLILFVWDKTQNIYFSNNIDLLFQLFF